jgi:hypothetical protein
LEFYYQKTKLKGLVHNNIISNIYTYDTFVEELVVIDRKKLSDHSEGIITGVNELTFNELNHLVNNQILL